MSSKDLPITVYTSPDGHIQLDVSLENDSILLNQTQIGLLFGVNRQSITKHTTNIYISGELDKAITCSILEQVQQEGKRSVTRKIKYYNLDMIISVGCRVNAKKATHFRQRATQVLKKHIVQGYTINPLRIQENYEQFLHAVEEIKHLSQDSAKISHTETLELIKAFVSTRFSLESYDANTLPDRGYTQENISIHVE